MKTVWAARAIALLAAAGCCNGVAWAACTVSSTGLAFGTYDAASGSDLTANGSVSVTCALDESRVDNYKVALSFSTGNSASYASRYMVRAGGTERLNYNLYNAGFLQVLGNGTAGTVILQDRILVKFNAPSNTRTFTVAGRIPTAQNALPGAYSDTIIVTVNF